MSATDLFPALRSLSREDKLKVMDFLAQELEADGADYAADLLQPGATYHVWSPFNSHGAAQTLAKLLEDTEQHD